MRIIVNSDRELVDEVNRQLKENFQKYGKMYCPCALEHTDDTICICKDFLESEELGECPCGKYIKVEE